MVEEVTVWAAICNSTEKIIIFRGNSAEYGGGSGVRNSNLISGSCSFRHNSAWQSGGGINVCDSTLNFIGNITFRGNSADWLWWGNWRFNNSTLNFAGTILFGNSSKQFGGWISLDDSKGGGTTGARGALAPLKSAEGGLSPPYVMALQHRLLTKVTTSFNIATVDS